MNDLEIIEMYWHRDEDAIRETAHKYGGFCYSLAMNILSVSEDAEECVNDTYQKAWNAIPPEKPHAFRAWLGRIVRNLSINRWHQHRAKKRYAGVEQMLSELGDCIPDAQTTEEIIENKELSQIISDWLDSLPTQDRNLFVRRYWNGEPLEQLARMCHTPSNKLAGRMFRLRKRLQAYLTEREVSI